MEKEQITVALIIDGYIQEILECDSRLAAILLSNPKVIDITEVKNDIKERNLFYNEEDNSFYKKIELTPNYENSSPVVFAELNDAQRLHLEMSKKFKELTVKSDRPCCQDSN